MQLKVWQTSILFRNAIKSSCLQKGVYTYIRKFIILSAVVGLAVSLSQRQNGKTCDGSEEKKAKSLPRKQRRRQSVNAASMPWSPHRERWVCERAVLPSVANKACGRLEKLPYPHVLCGAKPRSHPQNSSNVTRTLCPPHTFHTSFVAHTLVPRFSPLRRGESLVHFITCVTSRVDTT